MNGQIAGIINLGAWRAQTMRLPQNADIYRPHYPARRSLRPYAIPAVTRRRQGKAAVRFRTRRDPELSVSGRQALAPRRRQGSHRIGPPVARPSNRATRYRAMGSSARQRGSAPGRNWPTRTRATG